jgi:hypothetical protein
LIVKLPDAFKGSSNGTESNSVDIAGKAMLCWSAGTAEVTGLCVIATVSKAGSLPVSPAAQRYARLHTIGGDVMIVMVDNLELELSAPPP